MKTRTAREFEPGDNTGWRYRCPCGWSAGVWSNYLDDLQKQVSAHRKAHVRDIDRIRDSALEDMLGRVYDAPRS